jgi:dTDP-4-dehydrorhamnose reductase
MVKGKDLFLADSRLENRESVAAELDNVKPTHVLNAAGVTGRPNVDWCESNKEATVRANVIGTLNLSDLCAARDVHCTVFATGCIFEYDADHPLGSGKGFSEEDTANFFDSWYSKTKGMVEQMLQVYPTTCILRVRMPISDDLSPRNFITKIMKYDRVVNIPNSMTVLYELLPASLVMAQKKLTGVYNFCNPGVISHNEMLDLYIKYIDPTYTYTNFSLEEQAKILAAGRSNNELNCTKLVEAVPECEINEIHAACEKVFQRMKENLTAEGTYPDNLFKRAQK